MSLDITLTKMYSFCDCCGREAEEKFFFEGNITHNLGAMASEAGIYEYLWRSDEIGITKAGELIEPLKVGLAFLKSDPERFKAFNPKNGWGTYQGLIKFVENYLAACEKQPEAKILVSR